MCTKYPDLFAALAARFRDQEVRTRSQAGRTFQYVTARTVMNRLDEVLGPENWWDRYSPREHSVTCELSIRLPDGTVLTKCDAGGNAGMSDEGDDDKSGFSDSFKRAAVKFGVGRYLYGDGVTRFGMTREPGDDPAEPEHRPAPAQARNGKGRQEWQTADHGEAARRSETSEPRGGRALFAWIKDQDEKHGYGLLRHVSAWGKRQDLPARMVDWDEAQARGGYAQARQRMEALEESEHFQAALN